MARKGYSMVGPLPQVRFHLCDTEAELPNGLNFNNNEGDLAYTKDSDKIWKATAAGSWVEIGAGGVGAHATTHQNGGSDEVSVTGLSGLLADAQTPLAHTHDWADVTGEPATFPPSIHNILTGHNGFPGGTATFLRADGAFAAPTAEAAVTLTTVEKSIGAIARRAGKFQITGLAGLTPGKAVLIRQAVGPYTGKGTREDEAEMDGLVVSGKVFDATTIDAYWSSPTKVRGNFKFDYLVSA